MEWHEALILLIGCMLLLMAIGLPVALAFFGVNIVGAYLFLGGETGLLQLTRNSLASLASFTLAPIPLFLLMGEILFHTGIAFRAIDAVDKLILRIPGRLSIVTILGGTLFSSLSGSTLANTAVLGSVLLPDMLKRGYHPSIAMGPIMATGGIAMLIPPSALAVLLGSLAGVSITKLLIAGILPGLMMSVLHLGYVILRCYLNPDLAPVYESENLSLWQRIWPFLKYVVPLFSIFVLVVGSILAGWATPTESAAIGCMGAFLISIFYRSLSFSALQKALLETAKVSSIIGILGFINVPITYFSVYLWTYLHPLPTLQSSTERPESSILMPFLWSFLAYSAVIILIGIVRIKIEKSSDELETLKKQNQIG